MNNTDPSQVCTGDKNKKKNKKKNEREIDLNFLLNAKTPVKFWILHRRSNYASTTISYYSLLFFSIRADVRTAGASPNSFSAVAKRRFVAFGRRWLCKCWDGPPVVRLGCRPNATKRLLATAGNDFGLAPAVRTSAAKPFLLFYDSDADAKDYC